MKHEQGVFIARSFIEETLRNVPKSGKRPLEPFQTLAANDKLPIQILEDAAVINGVEVHKQEGDLWLCLEGEVVFIHGGELVNPTEKENPDGSRNSNELRSADIKDGQTDILRAGDWLWIPPGVPHQHNCEGVARLAIIKIPTPRTF